MEVGQQYEFLGEIEEVQHAEEKQVVLKARVIRQMLDSFHKIVYQETTSEV